MAKQTKTIEITNFGGRLTRINNGDLNSGFAKFSNSWGYDPFSKPMNLTWFEEPTEITGPINALPLDAKATAKSGVTNAEVFLIAQNGNLYTIQSSSTTNANVDSVIGIASVKAGGATYNFGASMDFYAAVGSVGGSSEQIYIGHDVAVNRVNFDGTADAPVGSQGFYAPNVFRPLRQFIGKLFFGNKNTLGSIDSTGTVTSPVSSVAGSSLYSDINPVLPVEMNIQDLDLTPDGNYLLLTAAEQNNYNVTAIPNNYYNLAIDSALYKWNALNPGITALTSLPGYFVTALQTYLGSNIFFSNNAFGGSVADETQKILTLPNNQPPAPNATCVNGNFLTWACVESEPGSNRNRVTLYYFGSLDQENPAGLYRLMRYSGGSLNGYVFQAQMNLMVANNYTNVNPSYSSIFSYGYGKHYIGAGAITTGGSQTRALLRFNVNSTGSGTPQSGAYETQNQLFSKRISIAQIRVYCDPTVTGNGFQLDVIEADNTLTPNGTFNYSFVAGSDETKMQGSLERINFNPNMKTLFSVGLRIANTGSTNMVIKKIEVDYTEEGR